MKLGLVLLLVSATLASVVEKHYHYHFNGNEDSHKSLLEMNPGHRGFFSKVWCRLSNWKKANVEACNERYAAKNALNKIKDDVKARLLVQKHMIQIMEHKLNWKKSKCWSKYFWSKARRQACLDNAKRLLISEIRGLNISKKHRAFWSKTKCFAKFMFNKTKRQACYEQVKAAEAALKNSKVNAVNIRKLSSSSQEDVIGMMEHKANWKKSKCWSLYFWNKAKRQACLNKATRLLKSEIRELSVSRKHRAFWSKTKCFAKFMFNKAKRQACYDQIKVADAAIKNSKQASK